MAMVRALVIASVLSVASVAVVTSESMSEPFARELSAVMRERKLDAIAAKDPAEPDRFVAAMLFPGQLLLVSVRYPAPALLSDQLARHEYGEAYAALSGAPPSTRETTFFVQDMGADGLQDGGDLVDVVYEKVVDQIIFDGHPERQKLKRPTYDEKYRQADSRYSLALKLLVQTARATRQ
jgi:hypothetical protein